MIGDDDDFEIPAFLRGDGSASSIVEKIEGDDDPFDFPTLDDADDGPVDIGFLGDTIDPPPAAEPVKPKGKTKTTAKPKPAAPAAPKSEPPKSDKPAEAEARAVENTNSGETIAAGQLRALIERLERLAEEKQTIADDMKEVMAEAKGTGFDTKAIRKIIALRKKDKAERDEEQAILDLYMFSLGM